MSLCRFLPCPSDRMSILWSLLSIEGAVILEYGPAGTTHFSMSLFSSLGLEQGERLFTTHMSEDDVVMGDVSRLEKAIIEVDKGYAPKVIFVVASSISAVIGTDIKGVCACMQEDVRAKLIAFEQGGFRGDFSIGLMETYTLLAKKLIEKSDETLTGTYNVLGLSMGEYRAKSDLWEIENLMREAFNFNLHACLCCQTSVSKIAEAGKAQINIVLSHEALPAAKFMEKQSNVPYVFGAPYGYQGTYDWLTRIKESINTQIAPVLNERLETRIQEIERYKEYFSMARRKENPLVSILGNYERVIGLQGFMKELYFEVENLLCMHSLRVIENPNPAVQNIPVEKERINILKSLRKQLVFADDTTLSLLDPSNTFMRVSLPLIHGNQGATHLPLMGEKGANWIMETVREYMQSLN